MARAPVESLLAAALAVQPLARFTPSSAAVAPPPIIQPRDWGSRPGDMSRVPRQDRWTWITIHHAGVPWTANKDAVRFVCGMQEWSKSPPEPPRKQVWNELPYHFMIAPDGRIFAARPLEYQPATNTHYEVAENITIELMGDFEKQRPRPEQLRAAARLTAWLSQRFRIPLDHIRGHKDAPGADGTDCPGKDFYRYLVREPGQPSEFQAWVAGALAGASPVIESGPALPNGPTAKSPAGLAPGAHGALKRCP